jgi:hypothetical protein
MKRLITLKTDAGPRVYVHLDNWGAGIDRLHRRWTRESDGWRCVDTGEVAHPAGFIFGRMRKTSTALRWRIHPSRDET